MAGIVRADPDLLIARDKMPGLTGEDIVRRLADRRVHLSDYRGRWVASDRRMGPEIHR